MRCRNCQHEIATDDVTPVVLHEELDPDIGYRGGKTWRELWNCSYCGEVFFLERNNFPEVLKHLEGGSRHGRIQ